MGARQYTAARGANGSPVPLRGGSVAYPYATVCGTVYCALGISSPQPRPTRRVPTGLPDTSPYGRVRSRYTGIRRYTVPVISLRGDTPVPGAIVRRCIRPYTRIPALLGAVNRHNGKGSSNDTTERREEWRACERQDRRHHPPHGWGVVAVAICVGKTKKDRSCTIPAAEGSDYCYLHDPDPTHTYTVLRLISSDQRRCLTS
jgi:hypothetical protein